MATGLTDVELAAGAKLMARLDAFAAFTDEPGRLTRLFLSEAHQRAAQAFIAWCGEAGLNARIDPPAMSSRATRARAPERRR